MTHDAVVIDRALARPMNEAMRRELSETDVAIKLANYVLNDARNDPDGDLSLLARQFLRHREVMRSIVHAAGGKVFVPSRSIVFGNDPQASLVVSRNDAENGYDVALV